MLVAVNMIGTGIFLLPSTMAAYGSISILGWVGAAVGAAAIGLMFAVLGSLDPQPGGPYAYARAAFGTYSGFQTNYVYWSANLIGNVAVATTVVGYLTEFFPALRVPLWGMVGGVVVVWLAALANIVGPRFVGLLTGWITVVAMVPLTLIAVVGWVWFDPHVFLAGWNPDGLSPVSAVSASATSALWAFMGVESAAVAAGVIANPRRNVPLATLLGLAIATALYVATCAVLMGIVPASELARSEAPFSLAAERALGTFGAFVIALAAILKSGASLVGWTLTIAQSAEAAAADGMFPRLFARVDRRGVPVLNYVVSAVLMTVIVVATASASLNAQFTEIIDMAIVLTLLPYLFTAVAFLGACRAAGYSGWKAWLAGLVAFLASAYCLWAVASSEATLVRQAVIFLFLSVPFYWLCRGRGAPADRSETPAGPDMAADRKS